jgi:acetoin utilization deacetylase AcuC-like enzyme
LTTLLIQDPLFLSHATPHGHPECADRLLAIQKALDAPIYKSLIRQTSIRAEIQDILRVHPQSYIDLLEKLSPWQGIPHQELVYIDGDTVMSSGSLEAAYHGAGAACKGVEAVMQGIAKNAFIASRPPGHHAEKAIAMGFCLLNNAAIAARFAQSHYGAERVAIVDFDVHHGNGTQDIFWDDASVLYCSSHQMPLFPGTGAKSQIGKHNNIVNTPLQYGSGSEQFRDAYEHVILPRLAAFRPDLIVISAGFDAHHLDPLGGLNLTEGDFAWVTEEIMNIAAINCQGRIVSVLEGGYNLGALGNSVAAHVGMLQMV